MLNRIAVLTIAMLSFFSVTLTRSEGKRDGDTVQRPPVYVPSGPQMYKDYCSRCHGMNAKGNGPASATLAKQPPDLTTLTKRHGGEFPHDYVARVLRFGPDFRSHRSSQMPAWGPIFQYMDNYNEAAVRQRLKNLCDYLESMQEE